MSNSHYLKLDIWVLSLNTWGEKLQICFHCKCLISEISYIQKFMQSWNKGATRRSPFWSTKSAGMRGFYRVLSIGWSQPWSLSDKYYYQTSVVDSWYPLWLDLIPFWVVPICTIIIIKYFDGWLSYWKTQFFVWWDQEVTSI